MNAGRELDVLIATQVMGLDVTSMPIISWDDDCTMQLIGVPRYSTEIGAAFQMLEGRFPWPQSWARLVRTSTGNWRCDIDLYGGDGPTQSAYAKTAPEAICRAALAAHGIAVPV